jgi:hypothetical protein
MTHPAGLKRGHLPAGPGTSREHAARSDQVSISRLSGDLPSCGLLPRPAASRPPPRCPGSIPAATIGAVQVRPVRSRVRHPGMTG